MIEINAEEKKNKRALYISGLGFVAFEASWIVVIYFLKS